MAGRNFALQDYETYRSRVGEATYIDCTRRGCGCTDYFDVGSYGHWNSCHRCLYCYAG